MEALSQPMTTDPCKHRNELVERLDILRRNESFCDVRITVKGKEFKAHRAVLAAASPFFLTLLTSDMRESNEQLIRIELEEATESIMEDVLKYIYTGNVLVTEERAHDLIATAEYLLLPSLKTTVCNFLKQYVSVENCVFNYYFADKYQCVELKEKTCEVINSNFTVVMETGDFLNLDLKQVTEWMSSDDITVSGEEQVFKGIVKWVSHNKSEREGNFPQLLHQVRLASISQDSLLNVCVEEELFAKNTEVGFNFLLNALKITLNASNKKVHQQPRKCLETCTDGIFVCGGRKALCYFPKQNVWYRLADSMLDHNDHAPTQCKSEIYMCGTCEVGESKVTEHYIPKSNTWGAMQRGILSPSCTGYTVFKGELYATYFSFMENGRIYRYDAESNYWNEMNSSPFIQGDPCVVNDEKFLYVISGRKSLSSVMSTTTTRFDPKNNKWEEVAGVNEGRYLAFGVAMNGKVFTAGGYGIGYNLLSSCEVYNPTTNEWQLMPSLKVPRCNASMVCFEERLYVLGGYTYTGRFIRALTVEVFESERNEWKEISAIPVKSFEEEEKKGKIFRACFARLYKGVIDKLKPLN